MREELLQTLNADQCPLENYKAFQLTQLMDILYLTLHSGSEINFSDQTINVCPH